MSKFERGITNKAFIAKLNSLCSVTPSFWNSLVTEKGLFIAIRNNSLNVYHKGNSICKLSYNNGDIIGSTHYKFLLNPILSEYVPSKNGGFIYPILKSKFLSSLDEIQLIKRASNAYAGLEKAGVHSITLNDTNVLDIEIEFISATRKIDRIDYMTLEERKDSIQLVFHEAKHFSNKELRGVNAPPVLGQLSSYTTALTDHAPEIIASYRMVCENINDLNLLKGRHLIKKVADGAPLTIDFEPRLIVFGFDRDQELGKVWEIHRKKLETPLGNRFKAIGKI